jgi:hypothetical protein
MFQQFFSTGRISRHAIIALFVTSGLLLSQCKKDDTTVPPVDISTDSQYISDSGPKVSTTLSGLVLDETQRPVPGALVEAYGKTVTTDAAGEFTLANIQVPANRCYLKCSKQGYFTGSSALIPQANGSMFVQMILMNATATHQIDAAAGGTASLSNGSSVQLPASGIVRKDGSPYSGRVNVTVRHLDPSELSFPAVVPGGDLAAQRTDNSGTILYSYGILRVLLRDGSGNDLQLANGKEATLKVAISPKQSAEAPATIPLWYFDEQKGLWREEGEATRQGNQYIGKVKHFTDWNCDVPGSGVDVEFVIETDGTGSSEGKVERTPVDPENPGDPITTGGIPCTGYPVRKVALTIGQAVASSDENGVVRRRVPDNRVLPVLLYQGPGLVRKIVDLGPYTLGQKPEKRTFKVPCPVFVVGRTVCNGTPIQANFVLNTNDILSYGKRPTDEKGVFRVTVAPGYESTITIIEPSSGKQRNVTFKAPNEDGVTVELGNIELCEPPKAILNDNIVTLNGDGFTNEVLDLNKLSATDNSMIGYCTNGESATATVGNDSTDPVSVKLQWPGCGKGEFNGLCSTINGTYGCRPNISFTLVKDGKRLNYYTAYGPNGSEKIKQTQITVTRYDNKLIEGTFSGIVTRHDSKTNQWYDLHIKDAKFSVRKK